MTFCILGHCPDADQVGIGFTTVTLAGGGISPVYSYAGDMVVVQAYGNPQIGLVGARALDAGSEVEAALGAMRRADPHFDFRQVGIMTRDGRRGLVTGPRTRPWAGHREGAGYAAMGNCLAGPEVVAAMADAFESSRGEALAERLLRAIEAGCLAGGQRSPDGGRYDERSCLLKVIGAGQGLRAMPILDLRIDMRSRAVEQMRRMFTVYEPVIARRIARAREPDRDPPTADWEARHLHANPPPPAVRQPEDN